MTKHNPGWNDAELGWVIAGNPVGVGIVILLRLLAAGLEIREFHIVAHDRDQRWIWSFEKGTFVQEPKGLHVHFLFKIEGHGRTLGQLAEIIGVNAECLLYPSRGKYAWDNPLAYLIHAKDSDRFQYDPHDVFTLKGTSYAEQYIRRKLDWDKGAATKTKARTDHDFEWLRELAAHGQATRDEILADAEKYRIYVRHQQAIDDALALCQRRVDSERRHEFLTDKGFRKRVIFIHGREGYGKTCLAKALVYSRHSLLGWTYDEEKPLLPSGHVMERMHGFDQYIADDVKPTAFGAMGDVKLLLDPDNVSYADQRFHVDDPIIYRQLVITSTLAPFDYFGPGFYVANESPGQAIRRLTRGIELLDYKAFGDYHVLVLVPQEVEPCRVAFRRHNRRSDENDVVYMDGVIYRMVPLQVEGETVLFTTTGAVEEQLSDYAGVGGPLAGVGADCIHEACQKAVERSYGGTPMGAPDPSLKPWVRLPDHPAIVRRAADIAAIRSKLAAGDDARYRKLTRLSWEPPYDPRGEVNPYVTTLPEYRAGNTAKAFASYMSAVDYRETRVGRPPAWQQLGFKDADDLVSWEVSDATARASLQDTPEAVTDRMRRAVDEAVSKRLPPHFTVSGGRGRRRVLRDGTIVADGDETDIGGPSGAYASGW